MAAYLLDTCAAIYLWSGQKMLPARVIEILRNPENTLVFHQISYLEMSIKYSLGKLTLKSSVEDIISEGVRSYEMTYHTLSNRGIAGLSDLPWLHRDPFDRLLISHARAEKLIFLTPDRQIKKYDVPVVWEE